MPWVVPAALIGGSILGASIQSRSVRGAARDQRESDAAAIAEQRRQFDLIRGDTAPWRRAGGGAVSRLSNLLGIRSSRQTPPPPPPPSDRYANAPLLGAGNFQGGGPGPNQERYDNDPVYRRAWDEALRLHQATYGSGYTRDSDPAALESSLNLLMTQYRAEGGRDGQGGTPKLGGTPNPRDPKDPDDPDDPDDPEFGRLNRRFGAQDLRDDAILQDSEIMRSLKGVDPTRLNKKFDEADFHDDAVTKLGFQFGLDEGRKGLDRMAGAQGMRRSGQTLKALTKFGTDYTGTKAGEAYDRFEGEKDTLMRRMAYGDTMRLGSYDRFGADNDRDFNRLATVAGLGTQATAQSGAVGAATGTNIGNILTAGGNARGAARIAQGNIWANAANNVGQWWMMGNRPPASPSSGGGY